MRQRNIKKSIRTISKEQHVEPSSFDDTKKSTWKSNSNEIVETSFRMSNLHIGIQ
jgi:hypothetical protein